MEAINIEELLTNVKNLLQTEYNLSYKEVEPYFHVVTNNWLDELELGESHLTAEDVALFIYLYYDNYHKRKNHN